MSNGGMKQDRGGRIRYGPGGRQRSAISCVVLAACVAQVCNASSTNSTHSSTAAALQDALPSLPHMGPHGTGPLSPVCLSGQMP